MKFIKTDLAKRLEEQLTTWDTEGTSLKYGILPNTLDFRPVRGTPDSAGFDLRACVEAPVTIFPDQVETIPTGVKIYIGSDLSTYIPFTEGRFSLAGKLYPRSSTKGCILNNTVGIVDLDYQGEVFIKLRNITDKAIVVNTGDAFSQIVFTLIYIPDTMEEVSSFPIPTLRGEGGFGSTDQQDLLGR